MRGKTETRRRAAVFLAMVLFFCLSFQGMPAQAAVQFTDVKVTELSASGYRVTATFSSNAGITKVLMPTWTEANGQDDLIWHEASVSGNAATFYVSTAAHRGESGAYITHIYVYDGAGGSALRGVNVTVPGAGGASPGAQAAPVITSAKVSELSAEGYLVTAAFTAGAAIAEVLMPTWTEANGQDDLVWHKAAVSGNTATFRVTAAGHKNESGRYITHIYVKDVQGRQALVGVNATVPAGSSQPQGGSSSGSADQAPAISNVKTEVKSDRITVTATVSAGAGISKVEMPTWTEANGQDDLIWHQASVSGNTASCDIRLADHKNETGRYITHIYLYDKAGRKALVGTQSQVNQASGGSSGPQTSAPVLKADKVTVSGLTAAGYTVTVDFTSSAGISKVEMPTWTEKNGQDDLIWHQASVSGNSASYTVTSASHKNESGAYITHIYLYDKAGNKVIVGTNATVPAASGGSSGSGSGSGSGSSSGSGSGSGSSSGSGSGSGSSSGAGSSAKAPEIQRIETSEISQNGYRLTVYFTADAGVDRVEMPTWTEANGQDDLTYHKAAVSGNSATCYIPAGDHKNESGNYMTHIYVYDKAGRQAVKGKTTYVPKAGESVPAADTSSGGPVGSGELSIISLRLADITSKGFWVVMTFNAPNGFSNVSAAVWTNAGWQDDVQWHRMSANGNTAAVYITTASHGGETGPYCVNAYVFENDTKCVMKYAYAPVPAN